MIAEVSVVPNSKRFSVSVKDGRVKISMKSPPEHNKANIELVRELSKLLGAPVRIISGHSSRRKRLDIAIEPEKWEEFLKKIK